MSGIPRMHDAAKTTIRVNDEMVHPMEIIPFFRTGWALSDDSAVLPALRVLQTIKVQAHACTSNPR